MLSANPTRSLPLGVGILGVLMIIAGMFDLVSGFGMTRIGDPFAFGSTNLSLFLALIYLATGAGFLGGVRFTWYLGFGLALLNLIRALLIVSSGGLLVSLPAIFVALLIIYYLLTPRTQEYFDVKS